MAVLGQWDSGTLPTTHGAGVSYAASGGWDGRPAIQFSQQSGDVSQVRFEFAAVSEFAVRAYIQMPAAWASTSASLIVVRSDSATIVGRAAIGGTGAPGEARLIRHDPSATVSVAFGKVPASRSAWWAGKIRSADPWNRCTGAVTAAAAGSAAAQKLSACVRAKGNMVFLPAVQRHIWRICRALKLFIYFLC